MHCITHLIIGQYSVFYCHNPTNNPKQLKTTFVGVVLLSVRKTTPHHTTTTTTTVSLQLGQFQAP
jgi:hypothetical protein